MHTEAARQEKLYNACRQLCYNDQAFALWKTAKDRHGLTWEEVREWLSAGYCDGPPPDNILLLGFSIGHMIVTMLVDRFRTRRISGSDFDNAELNGSSHVEEWDPDFDPRSILIKDL